MVWRLTGVGSAGDGSADAGLAETDSAETGSAETGSAARDRAPHVCRRLGGRGLGRQGRSGRLRLGRRDDGNDRLLDGRLLSHLRGLGVIGLRLPQFLILIRTLQLSRRRALRQTFLGNSFLAPLPFALAPSGFSGRFALVCA